MSVVPVLAASAPVAVGGTGTLSHVSFKATPTIAGGFSHSEWVNGESRLVKDNNRLGSGEIFGIVWSDSNSTMSLISSGDNGQTWASPLPRRRRPIV